MFSLIPDESLDRLRKQFGVKFDRLSPLEVQALVTADLEHEVTNLRLREMSEEHPQNITKSLQSLCSKGFLLKDGQGRWSSYRLPEARRSVTSLVAKAEYSSHKEDSSHNPEDWSHKLEELPEEELAKLQVIAAPAFHFARLPPDETRRIILQLCDGRYFTAADLGELMSRNSRV
jgi:hypothetical protein